MKSDGQSCHKWKLLSSDKAPQNGPIFMRHKMPEFFEKSPLSGVGKQQNFQVTSCLRFVSTNVGFACIESE